MKGAGPHFVEERTYALEESRYSRASTYLVAGIT